VSPVPDSSSTSAGGVIPDVRALLDRAHRLLEQAEVTSPHQPEGWTFFEIDQAIRSVSQAMFALEPG
jgi:hypothetical protein